MIEYGRGSSSVVRSKVEDLKVNGRRKRRATVEGDLLDMAIMSVELIG